MNIKFAKNIAGERFGELQALSRVGTTTDGNHIWSLRCSCGRGALATLKVLETGSVVSCGCCIPEVRLV